MGSRQRAATCAVLVGLIAGVMPCRAAVVVGDWQPIYGGIAYATGSADAAEPRLQQVRALRIDLQAAGLEFLATPHSGTLDTRTATTSAFLKSNSLQVAINAGFFALSNEFASLDTDINGLQVSRGAIVSAATTAFGNCILRMTTNNVAAFVTVTALPYNTADIYTAVPGGSFILVNGVGSTDTNTADPRSLAGLSADGRFLVLATIDGRQSGYSMGATYKECAAWLQRFGCHNGLNLDGGGSTTLVRSDGTGGATVLNRPSDFLRRERYVGSHLGVFAQNLPPPVTVTFDAQGGAVSPASRTVTNGLAYGALPAPTRSDYTFSGWWTSPGGTGLAVTSATVVAAAVNHVLYAKWTGDPCTVTFDAQGGAVSPASMTVTNGSAYGPLPTPTRPDYTFGGWWTGAGGTGAAVTSGTTVMTTANHALYAKWEAIPAVAAFNAPASTGRAPVSITFDDRSTGTITNRQWDFGDGTRTNTASTVLLHSYTTAGVYTVTLVVSGPLGASTNTHEALVVVYGFFENPIPYRITFEPPEMQSGDALFVPWNSNGWYGSPDGIVIVTNRAYLWAGAYPVASATHTNVLVFEEAYLTNRLAPVDRSSPTVLDLMLQPGWLRKAPDPSMAGSEQMAFFTDTNGHLNAWCSDDRNHTNRTWVAYTNSYIGETDWARLTVAIDYTSDTMEGVTYYAVALNGVALLVPGGVGYAYDRGGFVPSPTGIWLVGANPTVKRLAAVALEGWGGLDDFVATTNAVGFLAFPQVPSAAGATLLIIR